MTLVMVAVTATAVFFVQKRMVEDMESNLGQRFESEFNAVLAVQKANNAAVVELCRTLVRSSRVRAAIEDGARDLLYSIAREQLELRSLWRDRSPDGGAVPYPDDDPALQVVCYRFLDENGAVIPPPAGHKAGEGSGGFRDLAMDGLPEREQTGYVIANDGADDGRVHDVVVTPILSTDTGRPVAALQLVFKPLEIARRLTRSGMKSGVWADGQLDLPDVGADSPRVAAMISAANANSGESEGVMSADIGGLPYRMQFKRLNPGPDFHPGVLVSLFPMSESSARHEWVRWEIIGAGAVLLVGGLLASHFLSARFSMPVAKLASVSSENAEQRDRAEAALVITNEELRVRNTELQSALAELKETQQRVIQQERLRALGQMASGVAHDFNNALVPILGFSELLQLSPGVMADHQRAMSYIGMIHTAAGDAAKVVSRLKQFYRKQDEGDAFVEVDLCKLVTQAITLTQPKWKDQAQAAGATIRVESSLGEVPPVLGDESALREVLTNLIFNAVDAMPAGGSITVRTRRDGVSAVVEVTDTGSGMSDEVRKRCLEPFFTTKGERGTGLGLSMVFGIVQRHGGLVDIESELGKGTTFILRLPMQKHGANAVAHAAADEAGATCNLGILVVDDEPEVRSFVSAALTHDGHRVELASDGAEGLRRFRDGAFDMVITDKAMPGMSGDQMASAMKLMKPGTPVILLTGFGQFLDKADLPGVDVLLSKPVGIQQLRAAVHSALAPV